MKLFLVLSCIFFSAITVNAQEKDKLKVGFDLGIINVGLAARLEPKYNLTDNSSVGLRLGVEAQAEREITSYYGGFIEMSELGEFGSFSIMGTYDRYFSNQGSSLAWFIGGGFGYYNSTFEDYWEGSQYTYDGPIIKAEVNAQVSVMLRTGFDLGSFRFGLEYNIIPKTDVVIPSGKTVGHVKDSYFGVTLGFVIGGGNWKKA